MENKNPPRKALFQILPTKIKSKVISIPTQQEVVLPAGSWTRWLELVEVDGRER